MLPSAAEMPPCAATVCQRVGKTFVRHAVVRPVAARPNVARRPAPPAPTTTMSYLCSVILYVSMRSGSERDADDGEHARGGAEETDELDENLQRELEALRVHVILDDDLQAK